MLSIGDHTKNKLQIIPHATQPATKTYQFDAGWQLVRTIIHLFSNWMLRSNHFWFGGARRMTDKSKDENVFVILVFFLASCMYISMGCLVYTILGAILLTIVAALSLFLAVWAALSTLIIGILALTRTLYMRFFHIFYRCPHAYCYTQMSLPTFICPTCRAEHTQLCPSVYGILSHRCRCGQKLPTLDALGRRALTRICVQCRNPLSPCIGQSTDIHIPIVGAPSTGKTNYLVMALNMLIAATTHTKQYAYSFPDQAQLTAFNSYTNTLAQGRTLPLTPDIAPQAYTLKMQAPSSLLPKLAFFYDAAGEAFNSNENINTQKFYRYMHGLIFMIDPSSISLYVRNHQQSIEQVHSSLRPSDSDIIQVYERMMRMVEDTRHLQKRGRYTFPIAIVITKVDALGLEDEIGAPAAQKLMQQNASITNEGDAINILVRNFLLNQGLSNLVRELDLYFSHIRYFSCSSLGRLPDHNNTHAFVPIRVLDPLLWILQESRVVKIK